MKNLKTSSSLAALVYLGLGLNAFADLAAVQGQAVSDSKKPLFANGSYQIAISYQAMGDQGDTSGEIHSVRLPIDSSGRYQIPASLAKDMKALGSANLDVSLDILDSKRPQETVSSVFEGAVSNDDDGLNQGIGGLYKGLEQIVDKTVWGATKVQITTDGLSIKDYVAAVMQSHAKELRRVAPSLENVHWQIGLSDAEIFRFCYSDSSGNLNRGSLGDSSLHGVCGLSACVANETENSSGALLQYEVPAERRVMSSRTAQCIDLQSAAEVSDFTVTILFYDGVSGKHLAQATIGKSDRAHKPEGAAVLKVRLNSPEFAAFF